MGIGCYLGMGMLLASMAGPKAEIAPLRHPSTLQDIIRSEQIAPAAPDGRPVYLVQDEEFQRIRRMDMSPQDIHALLDLRDSEGEALLTSLAEIEQFKLLGGTFQKVKMLLSLRNSERSPVFDTFTDVLSYFNLRKETEVAERLSGLCDDFGNSIFDQASSILYYLQAGGTYEFARDLLAIRNSRGEQIFDNRYLLLQFQKAEGTPRYAEILEDMKDATGQRVFEYASHIVYFKEARGTILFAERLSKVNDEGGRPRFGSFEIYRFAQLRLSVNDILGFTDTGKPNALVIFPTCDDFGALEHAEANRFFRRLKKAYDTKYVFASDEDAAYQAIGSMQGIDLLVLVGHGPYPLTFGDGSDERATLDESDVELAGYADHLSRDAAVFVCACENDRLVRFLSGIFPGRRIIGSKKDFSIAEIVVNTLIPFNVDIISDGKNSTYRK